MYDNVPYNVVCINCKQTRGSHYSYSEIEIRCPALVDNCVTVGPKGMTFAPSSNVDRGPLR